MARCGVHVSLWADYRGAAQNGEWYDPSVVGLIDLWRKVVYQTVKLFKYKGAIFVALITKDTPAMISMNTFIKSSVLSEKETKVFERVRAVLLSAVRREKRVVAKELVFLDISGIVAEDARSRQTMPVDRVKKEPEDNTAEGVKREAALADPVGATAMAEKLTKELAAIADQPQGP
jgi:hypothetical protein